MRTFPIEYNFLYNFVSDTKILNKMSLSSRSQMILEMRWRYGYDYSIIGKQFGITAQRAREIYEKELHNIFEMLHTIIAETQANPGNEIIYIESIKNFNPRVKSLLKKINILSLNQLANTKKEHIKSSIRFGKQTLDYLEQILQSHNLAFAS